MKPGLYFHHHRTPNNGVITFAIEIKENPLNWVQFSFALCSPKDKFCKKKGREIAVERLNNSRARKVSGFHLEPSMKLSDVINKVISEYWTGVRTKSPWIRMKRGIIPGWILRAEKKESKKQAEKYLEKLPEAIVRSVVRGLDALSDPKKEIEEKMAEVQP